MPVSSLSDICPNPTSYALSPDQRAEKVTNLKITEITKELQFPTNSRRDGNYTCIEISYVIEQPS